MLLEALGRWLLVGGTREGGDGWSPPLWDMTPMSVTRPMTARHPRAPLVPELICDVGWATPQLGHCFASVLTSFPHSRHAFRAMGGPRFRDEGHMQSP